MCYFRHLMEFTASLVQWRTIYFELISFNRSKKVILIHNSWLTSTSFGLETIIFNSGPSHTRKKSPYCLTKPIMRSKFSVRKKNEVQPLFLTNAFHLIYFLPAEELFKKSNPLPIIGSAEGPSIFNDKQNACTISQ